jgi:hypothetical protein
MTTPLEWIASIEILRAGDSWLARRWIQDRNRKVFSDFYASTIDDALARAMGACMEATGHTVRPRPLLTLCPVCMAQPTYAERMTPLLAEHCERTGRAHFDVRVKVCAMHSASHECNAAPEK